MDTDALVPVLEDIAPSALAESWDRVGWQVRHPLEPVSGILVAMEVTLPLILEAVQRSCNFILSHHPMFYRPLDRLDLGSPAGAVIARLLATRISVWAAHTNLDLLPEGTSFAMARALGISPEGPLSTPEPDGHSELPAGYGFGSVGVLPAPMNTGEIARWAADTLRSTVCQVAGDPGRVHRRVAVMGGSGAQFAGDAQRAGATLFITADVKYHEAQDAVNRGLDLVILDHYATERPVLDLVRDRLSRRLPGLEVTVATTGSSPFVRVP